MNTKYIRKVCSFLMVGFMLINVGGCVTSASGTKNPSYYGTKISKVAVLIQGADQSRAMSVEQSALQRLREAGIQAQGFTQYVPFNKPDKLSQIISEAGFEYVIAFSSSSNTETYATGNYSHSGTYTPNVAGGGMYSGTTYQQRSTSKDTAAVAMIYSLTDDTVVWSGQGQRYSQGAFAVFDLSAAEGVLDELIGEMLADGILSSR